MALFVDTSVWSLAYRRDAPPDLPQLDALRTALLGADPVVTTVIVLLELLRGFLPGHSQTVVRDQVGALPFIDPHREDYSAAAALSNACRAKGVQLHTIDALIAQLCIRERLTLLTTDADFSHAANHIPLRVWRP